MQINRYFPLVIIDISEPVKQSNLLTQFYDPAPFLFSSLLKPKWSKSQREEMEKQTASRLPPRSLHRSRTQFPRLELPSLLIKVPVTSWTEYCLSSLLKKCFLHKNWQHFKKSTHLNFFFNTGEQKKPLNVFFGICKTYFSLKFHHHHAFSLYV